MAASGRDRSLIPPCPPRSAGSALRAAASAILLLTKLLVASPAGFCDAGELSLDRLLLGAGGRRGQRARALDCVGQRSGLRDQSSLESSVPGPDTALGRCEHVLARQAATADDPIDENSCNDVDNPLLAAAAAQADGSFKFDPAFVLVDGWGIVRGEYRYQTMTPDSERILRHLGVLAEEVINSQGANSIAYEAAHYFLCYAP